MPINDNPGTLEEWNTFISEYESNLAIKKTALDAKLNDGALSDADKKTALEDYRRQESYLQWLKTKRDEYAATGEIPADMTLDITANGDLYRYNGEIRIANLPPLSSYTGTVITLGTVNIGTTRTTTSFEACSAPDCNVSLDWGGLHTFDEYKNESLKLVAFYSPNAHAISFGVTINHSEDPWVKTFYMAASASGSWVTETGYTPASPASSQGDSQPSGNVLFIIGYNYEIASTINDIPEWSNSIFYAMFSGPLIWQSYSSPTRLFARRFCSVSYSGDLSDTTPWDFYNDDILPDVNPDNAVFPEGYNPDPEKPDPELPDLPGESENGGDDMERNDITGVGGSFGFLTQYALRGSDIENLGQKLWNGFTSNPSDPDYPDDVTKYLLNFVYSVNPDTGSVNMADIMEFFVSLKMYPFPLGNVHTLRSSGHNLYIGSGTKPIVMNNIIYTMDSYVGKLDCGTLTIPFWFGDYRDYELEIALYLPYCGTVQLNPGDVLGGEMHCEYVIDFCTGSCTAFVDCTTWDNHKITVASLSGQIGADVPMSATNAGRVASRVLNDRINVAENILSPLKAATTGIGAIMSGNFAGAIRQGFDVFISPSINEQKQLAGMGERGAISAPVLGGGGGFSAFAGLPAVFCQVRSPFFTDADNYADAVGLPSSDTAIIGNCTGFCAFHNVDMSSLVADADTKNEIRRLLESGVYI